MNPILLRATVCIAGLLAITVAACTAGSAGETDVVPQTHSGTDVPSDRERAALRAGDQPERPDGQCACPQKLGARVRWNRLRVTWAGEAWDGDDSAATAHSGWGPLIMMAAAYKESSWNPTAKNPSSTATGLYQILAGTADDIQDRVHQKFVVAGRPDPIPGLQPGQRLLSHRRNPAVATYAATVYLLDRIASAGNHLETGLGTGYGEAVIDAADAIKRICEFGTYSPDHDSAWNCFECKCEEIIDAIEPILHPRP